MAFEQIIRKQAFCNNEQSPQATVLQRVERQALQQLWQNNPPAARMAKRVIIDPGRDISPGDSSLWLSLLTAAEQIDSELYARLFCLRGAGCRLEPHLQYGYIIAPVIDGKGVMGWASRAEYEREVRCLQPYVKPLTELLRKIAPAQLFTGAGE